MATGETRSGRFLGSIRLRILAGAIGLLAFATVASVLVARDVLQSRLDERIEADLRQEAAELRSLAGGSDPETGEPFGSDVRRVFDVVDVYVGYLRKKLGKDRITSVRRMGYRLERGVNG